MIGNISPVQLVIILVIVVVIFGTKKLRSMGSDVGGAVKSFRKAMDEEEQPNPPAQVEHGDNHIVDAKVETKQTERDG